TVTQAAGRVRVTAQLINARKDVHLWSESYERLASDVFSLQGEIARAIAKEVRVVLTPQEQARLTPRVVNTEAYHFYLQGLHRWRTRKIDALRESVTLFQQAIAKEPSYARAYAGLADAYSVLSGRADGQAKREFEAKSCAAAAKAVELDETLGESH